MQTEIPRLPTHPFIPCSTPDCTTQTTCFGQNLQSKIKQHETLQALLAAFKCRVCRASIKQPLGTAIKLKPQKQKRITKSEERVARVKEMISSIPQFNFGEKKSVAYLRESPDIVREITKSGSCIRPDIYLDSDRVCDDCGYNIDCLSKIKAFSKHYIKQTL
jgi:hypothetical protein